MKKRGIVILVAFLILIFPGTVLAVGISPPSYYTNMIYGQSEVFQFHAINTMGEPISIEIKASEEYLEDYITIDNSLIYASPKEWKPFTLKIDYPDGPLKPGLHKVNVYVTEQRESAGMISARASVIGIIDVMEAYPGLYAEAILKAEDRNINETVPILVTLNNYGTETIKKAAGYVDIYFNEEKITTLELSSVENITTYDAKTMSAQFDTKGFMPGKYAVKATIVYDTNTTSAEGTFKIGTLHVDIVDFTKQAYQNKINPFEIIIESKWNERISNIYADVNVKENDSIVKFKTISEGLNKWEQKTILGYFDASGISLGEHDIEIYLNYEGLQTIEKGKINVTEEIKPVTEEPKPSRIPVYITALIAVLIAVIIFLIIISVGRKKSGEKEAARTYYRY